ncbi:MAG: hypothetical protein HYT76_03290 [Deltaproteobacteria bacterium]|nr:hypothetical protein [Deltaproteobacteria bacterium]
MEQVLTVLNNLELEGVIERYALAGATALLFYAEPALTYDLDVFIFLPETTKKKRVIVDMGPLYIALRRKGYTPNKEQVIIKGIPVQFIPSYNPLVDEAVREAVEKKYQGVQTRVARLEHLLAIMIDTDRSKDRERIRKLWEEVKLDRHRLREILTRHKLIKKWEWTIGKIK